MSKINRSAVSAPGSIASMEAHRNISAAVQPELDSMTEMQHNAVGGKYRPDMAVSLILQLEDCRDSILTACDALHRALHRSRERARDAQARADDNI